MELKHITIRNFRAHVNSEIKLSQFACLIGENNAGKSTVLHAIHFALTGNTPRRLSQDDFNDPQLAIRVSLIIRNVKESDLAHVPDSQQREKLREVLVHEDGQNELHLVRTASLEKGKVVSSLTVETLQPRDPNYSLDRIETARKGKTGAARLNAVLEILPELQHSLTAKSTVTEIDTAAKELIQRIPRSELELTETKLPTGIPNSINAMLPEVIYIEAVKDSANEAKNSDSSTFGKLLRIVLEKVQHHFEDLEESFKTISKALNREDDATSDERLDEIQQVEKTILNNIRESFPDVDLELTVPAPSLKTIFSGANLVIDDGHPGPLDGKGDGLQRTVAFAILRAYLTLNQENRTKRNLESGTKSNYVLLFEEPELYLYPTAQEQLFEALASFSEDHTVVATTHSPSFFDAQSTASFTKLVKDFDPQIGVDPVNVDVRSNLTERDAFQMICYENNVAALFASTVVLVEGDSDAIVFPHLAKCLRQEWNPAKSGVKFIPVGGKGSIPRYRSFFENFNVKVHSIVDLDTLTDGFSAINRHGDQEEESVCTDMHSNLMQEVSAVINNDRPANSHITNRQAKKLADRGDLASIWEEAYDHFQAWKTTHDVTTADQIESKLEEFFSRQDRGRKTAVLKELNSAVSQDLDSLLIRLSRRNIHVLRLGELEDYYGVPSNNGLKSKSSAEEKISAATEFISSVSSPECLINRHEDTNKQEVILQEFQRIFESVFKN